MSFLTGILSFFVMTLIGIDFAPFWALLIFLFNFIPTIGSILGVLFPTLLALVQFEQGGVFVATLILLLVVQLFVGNFLEPRLVGKSLNLSPMVILFSLVFWGQVWGVIGMLLCVPLMVMLNLVLAQFPKTRPIALMLSSQGDVRSLY